MKQEVIESKEKILQQMGMDSWTHALTDTGCGGSGGRGDSELVNGERRVGPGRSGV